MSNYDLVVFSHLRWEFVFQRPQHLLNRFAQSRKVLFVEEPIPFDDNNKGTANILSKSENLTVLQPRISWGNMTTEIIPLVTAEMKHLEIATPVLWFYAPMYSQVIENIPHSLIIFDCMDELKAFKGAPPALLDNEKYLLSKADIVFTGGKSLYDSKKKVHNNVYCFPSSVDRNHFAQSLDKNTNIPEDIANLKKPTIGFYGVIDERIDLELLQNIAKKLPKVSFVMIGPVVKINEADLPRLHNIHYLGAKKYDELPRYLKGIDIAFMPFALNESTKFISPTKTLEFMAALKPIISTPIYDIVRDYKNEVVIVSTAIEFIQAINNYIKETSEQKYKREKLQSEVIDRTSWDKTYIAISEIINE